jgi:hypothetical protein
VKVGDFIADKSFPDDRGVIICEDPYGDLNAYKVLSFSGDVRWYTRWYIEDYCEVINESR